ncbi:hypothetical protein QJQ45_015670 [Haematococcus lacustris]|nr:hypothetical protein QJQ45_015670 [Haematococcus lacustris]
MSKSRSGRDIILYGLPFFGFLLAGWYGLSSVVQSKRDIRGATRGLDSLEEMDPVERMRQRYGLGTDAAGGSRRSLRQAATTAEGGQTPLRSLEEELADTLRKVEIRNWDYVPVPRTEVEDEEATADMRAHNAVYKGHATTSTPGASLDGMAHAVWSPHEQELLNELLLEYPAEQSAPTERYIHIAAGIPNKTVRDVALRIRWMLQQQKQHFKAKEEHPKKHSKASRCAQASAGNMTFPDPPALMASPQHSMLYSLDLLPPVTGFRLLGMDDSPDFDHPQHDLELSLNALDLPSTNLPSLHLHTALARSSTPLPLLSNPTLHNMQGPTPPQPLLPRAKHEGPPHAQLSLQLPSLPALNAAALPSPGRAGSTPGSSPAFPPSFPCWPGGPHFPGLPSLALRPTPSLQPEQEPQQQLSLREGVGGLQAEPGGPGMQPGAGAGAQPGSARAQGPGQGQADPDHRLPGLGQALLQGTGKMLHPDPDHSTGRGTALGLGGTSQPPKPGRPAGEPLGLDTGVKLEAAGGPASGQGGAVAAQLQGLLDSNAGLLAAFKANMAQCKVVENTGLLMQFRDTLMATLQVMNSSQGAMLNMPPLPVQLNLEQAARCLPPPRPPSMHPPSCPLPGPGPGTLSWPPAFPHLLPPGMPAMQGMGMLGLHPMQAMMMGGAMGLPPHGAASGMLGSGGPSLPGVTQPGLTMPPGPWLPPLAMLQGPLALGPLPELPVPPSAGQHQPGLQQQEGQQLCALPPPITLMPGPLLPCTSGGGSGDPGQVPSLATGSGSAGDFGAAGSGQASGSAATSRLHGSGAAAALTRPSSRCGSDQEVLKPGSARSGSSRDPFPGLDQPASTSVPKPVQPLALQQATPPAPAAALAVEHAPPAEQPLLCGPGSSPGEDTKGHGDKSSGSGLSMACSGGGSAQAAHLMHCSPDATPTTTAQPASAAPQAPQPPVPAPQPSAASRPSWVRSATASGSSREGAQQDAQPQPAQASGCLDAPVAQTATAPAGLQAAATAGGLTGTLGAGGTVVAASVPVQVQEGGSLAAPAPAAGAPGGNPGAVMPGWLPGWPGQGGPHGAQGPAGHMFAGMHGAMAHAPMQHMMMSPFMQNSPMGMPGPWGPGMPMLPAFFPGQGSWMAMGPPGLGAPAGAAQPPASQQQQQQQHMQMQQQQMQMQMQQQHMQMQHFAHMQQQQQQMQFQYHAHQMQFMQQ